MPATLAINLQEDVVPYSTFRSSLSTFMAKTRKTHRPILVTQNGKSASVLMDVADFEALKEREELLADIARAEEDVKAGRVTPHEQVFEDLRAKFRE